MPEILADSEVDNTRLCEQLAWYKAVSPILVSLVHSEYMQSAYTWPFATFHLNLADIYNTAYANQALKAYWLLQNLTQLKLSAFYCYILRT